MPTPQRDQIHAYIREKRLFSASGFEGGYLHGSYWVVLQQPSGYWHKLLLTFSGVDGRWFVLSPSVAKQFFDIQAPHYQWWLEILQRADLNAHEVSDEETLATIARIGLTKTILEKLKG